jgi:aminopeptidase N
MYPKGGNLLHAIRHSMNDDEKFRQILRGLNKEFYHQTVNTEQVENYISTKAGFNFSKVFDQYLRNIAIPKFEFKINGDSIEYRYSNCISGFNLPIVLKDKLSTVKLLATDEWNTSYISKEQALLMTVDQIKKMYYIEIEQIK